jgi:hypothetical protein
MNSGIDSVRGNSLGSSSTSTKRKLDYSGPEHDELNDPPPHKLAKFADPPPTECMLCTEKFDAPNCPNTTKVICVECNSVVSCSGCFIKLFDNCIDVNEETGEYVFNTESTAKCPLCRFEFSISRLKSFPNPYKCRFACYCKDVRRYGPGPFIHHRITGCSDVQISCKFCGDSFHGTSAGLAQHSIDCKGRSCKYCNEKGTLSHIKDHVSTFHDKHAFIQDLLQRSLAMFMKKIVSKFFANQFDPNTFTEANVVNVLVFALMALHNGDSTPISFGYFQPSDSSAESKRKFHELLEMADEQLGSVETPTSLTAMASLAIGINEISCRSCIVEVERKIRERQGNALVCNQCPYRGFEEDVDAHTSGIHSLNKTFCKMYLGVVTHLINSDVLDEDNVPVGEFLFNRLNLLYEVLSVLCNPTEGPKRGINISRQGVFESMYNTRALCNYACDFEGITHTYSLPILETDEAARLSTEGFFCI